MANNKIIDLRVWIKKYFIISSLLFLFFKIKIKLKDLNSKNTHKIIQFILVITPSGDKIKIIHLIIYKKDHFQWGMSPLAFIAYLILLYSLLFPFFLLGKSGLNIRFPIYIASRYIIMLPLV
jgi:hypothetical protein